MISSMEEKKLRTIVAHPVFGALLGMKKYKTNDSVVFEGAVNTISWEDRLVGKRTLPEVRALAAQEGLDYVLMHEYPITIRVMNYENFMCKAFTKDPNALSRRSKLPKGRFQSLDGYSEPEDLYKAVTAALEDSVKGGVVGVEVGVMNRTDKDQLQRSLVVVEKVEQAVERLGSGQYRSTREDHNCLFRVLIQHLETESKKQAALQLKAKAAHQFDEDEEALVSQFAMSNITTRREDGMLDIDDSLDFDHREDDLEISPEVVASLPTGTLKRRMTEEALRRALGAKLANRMLKGRIKPN